MSKTGFKQRLPSEATLKEKWQTTGGWLLQKNADPKDEAALNFYADKGKMHKTFVNVGKEHS
jgi:hypothetical protein